MAGGERGLGGAAQEARRQGAGEEEAAMAGGERGLGVLADARATPGACEAREGAQSGTSSTHASNRGATPGACEAREGAEGEGEVVAAAGEPGALWGLTPEGDVLVVAAYGALLGKHSERLQVRVKKEVVQEAPLFRLRQVLVATRGVLVSSDVLRECAARGIAFHVLGRRPQELLSLTVPLPTATVATRRQQLLASLDERGVAYARAIVAGKLRNQASLLKYTAKYRKRADGAQYGCLRDAAAELEDLAHQAEAQQAPSVEAARAALLSLEARGGRQYWQAIAALLRPRYPRWPGRQHQEAQDPINAALSYGYAILAAEVHLRLLLAGLDPAAGFLHADRPGKMSLVYDAMEEFRQTVVDRPLLGLLNRGLELELEAGRLRRADRQRLAMVVLERLRAVERHDGRRLALRAILAQQAEQLATFVRRERASYTPFVARW